MKTFLFIVAISITALGFAQPEKMETCEGLPIANPTVKASISISEITQNFESSISEKLKKGTHAAVYKVFVNCNGDVTDAIYQRGTFSESDQSAYQTKMLALKWKPAYQKSKAVNSIVFVSLEIVNGKVTVVIQ